MSYSAFVFCPRDSTISLDDVDICLQTFFEASEHSANRTVDIRHQSDHIHITHNHWSVYIATVNQPPTHLDGAAIAAYLAQIRPELLPKMPFDCRWEIFSDKDRTLEYFNDYALIVEQLMQLPDVILYESASGRFI